MPMTKGTGDVYVKSEKPRHRLREKTAPGKWIEVRISLSAKSETSSKPQRRPVPARNGERDIEGGGVGARGGTCSKRRRRTESAATELQFHTRN